MGKFMIRLQGAVYANELYGASGDHIYDLDEAIQQAETQFGPSGWELWNGSAEENRLEES